MHIRYSSRTTCFTRVHQRVWPARLTQTVLQPSQLSVDCRTYRHTHCDNALLISFPDPPFPQRWMYFRSPARGIGDLMISTHNLLNRMGLGRLEPPSLSEPVATATRNMMNIITMANFDSILQVNSVLTTSDTFAA